MTKFEKECEGYSIDDLELIIDTQQDLYNEQEMQYLIQLHDKKLKIQEYEEEQKRINSLPEKIKCPKCDMIISGKNEKCPYCEFEFGEKIYQYDVNNESEEFDENEEGNSNAIAYIFSFIIPLVGFIIGAILMTNDDEDKKSQGITCIVLGIVSVIISIVFLSII